MTTERFWVQLDHGTYIELLDYFCDDSFRRRIDVEATANRDHDQSYHPIHVAALSLPPSSHPRFAL